MIVYLPLKEFLASLRSPESQVNYRKAIRYVLGDGADGFLELARGDKRGGEDRLILWVVENRGRLAATSVRMRLAVVKSFLDFEYVELNWKRVYKPCDRARFVGRDRPPTVQEVRLLLILCDRRMRAVVLIMVASGVRIGAFDSLDVGDYARLPSGVGRLRVYRGSSEEYFAFLTPEAVLAVEEYLKMRREAGESLSVDSPLIRNLWSKDIFGGRSCGKIKRSGHKPLSYALYKLWVQAGLKHVGQGRGEFKQAHGFRKFFKTHANQVMKPDDVEVLMGHSLGLSDSYYHPTPDYLEKEYLKAVPLLTISEVEEVRREAGVEVSGLKNEIKRQNDTFVDIYRQMEEFKKALKDRGIT